ncbi:MAG: ATP-grasp domain-containing protein [Tissierellaceae bacterium]
MRILLTAIGKRVQLVNHLKKHNYVIGVDAGTLSPARYFVDNFYQIPFHDDRNYINTLLDICKTEQIDMLIPLYEKEFIILDEYRKRFNDIGTFLLLSDKSILEICNDKWNTYNFFRTNNINTPKTYLLEDIRNNRLDINYPLILKPRDGMGSKGIFHVKGERELSYFSSDQNNYIIQEEVKGVEYTMDVLCDLGGKILSIVPRQRLEVRAGEVVKSRSVKDFDLIDSTLDLVNKLNSKNGNSAIGPMNIQCIVNKEKDIKFIEVNPRFGGGVPLTFESGVDYSKIFNDMVAGRNISPSIGDFRELVMLRYDEAIFREEI